ALARAITDSTSTSGAYPPAEVLRNLEVYLADPRSTDVVYEGLVHRACAEPLSLPLVEKVVGLLKAYLLKYVPSQDVMHGLIEFSSKVSELPRLSPGGRKAVAYVKSCLRQLGGERVSSSRGLRGSSNSLGNMSAGRSREDLPRLGTNIQSNDGRVTAMKVSVSSSALGRANDRYAAADALPSPTDADPGPGSGQMLAWLGHSDGRNTIGYQDIRLAQGSNRVEPPWAVPSRPLLLPPTPPGVTSAHARSWLQHLPDLAQRVTMAAPVPDMEMSSSSGAAGFPAAAPSVPLSLSGAPPISLATIHRCVLDLEEQDIGRHITEVLGEARAEAQQLQPATPRPRQQRGRGGLHGGGAGREGPGAKRSRPPRLLFHHPPYNRAEHLPLMEADVSVVVEAVCGVRAASAMAAVMGPLHEREATNASGQAEGMWQAAFEEDGEFGQICGGILVKLLVDMWTRAEPQDFFIIVLRMLCRALRSAQPSTRARAFDVLYNLYIHGAMLRTDAEEAALTAAAAETVTGAGGVQMPWQVCASAPVSPFVTGADVGGGGQTPHLAVPRGSGPLTPAPSTSEPQMPGAVPGGVKPGYHQVTSHSLGLQGSALLDSTGELPGMPSGPSGSRTGLKPGGDGAGMKQHMRKDSGIMRLPPPPPSPVASPSVQVTARGSAPSTTSGSKADITAGYDRWLRALLFRLLFELQQTLEDAEEVWRAAMGCLAQMCTHGGYWVAAWVQHMPPSALSCLLRAACNFSWSQKLYAQLLKLVPCVLTRPTDATTAGPASTGAAGSLPSPGSTKPLESAFAAPAALKSAVAAAADDSAAAATRGAAETEEMRRRLAEFGGMHELLFHFVRAPTPDSRTSLLTSLVQCCVETPGGSTTSSVSVSGSGDQQVHGFRSPRTSGSPGSRGLDGGGGPVGVLAVFQSLHLDSVCLALRAAVERPWQGMSSRLADVLASTSLDLGGAATNPVSPSGSVSASADYPLSAMHTPTPGLASPIAVRELLRPLLENLEACCVDSMTLPQVGEMRTHIDVSVAHIAGASNVDAASPPTVTAAAVTAAWRCFKDVCNIDKRQARVVAVQWLHKLLSAACRACQGQILLLSPLTLKTSPEASRLAAATSPSTGPNSPRALWNTALADALLHVVREAPQGCELLMKAITRTAADLKSATGPTSDLPGSMSPRLVAASPHGPAAAAAAGVTAEEVTLVACRRVMWLYYVGLQWMLQCGSAEARMPTVVDLADVVLAGLLQPDPAAEALQAASAVVGPSGSATAIATANKPPSGGAAYGAGRAATGGTSSGGGVPHSQLMATGMQQGQQQHPLAAAVQEPGGGMLISQQLIAGLLAFDPDALACTPPELLVTLLQQCSQNLHDMDVRSGGTGSHVGTPGERDSAETVAARAGGQAGFRSMHRGFLGRPCAMEGMGAPAARGTGDGANNSGRPKAMPLRANGSSVGAGGGGGGGEAALSGAAVGPWQDDWQDRRLALLLLLIARCSLDPEAFAKYSLSHVIKAQLSCDDLRCRYYAGVYLLKHWMLNQHDKYWRTLRHIIGTAQQLNDERLLDNPYLQMRTMLNVDHV
ncbi:hypothetical protein VaNZ11_008219, partial [Volvox africanus]